ncbi:alpha-L-glutamate ligase [Streptomyces mobaraensis]|uniref:alpha-L-glutamate ligase n=1 Tax=Streptomyces mobaraensis TaxID=35621 RepID=UPI003324B19E
MALSELVLMTDHSSTEGSREMLVAAARTLTGREPVQLDARHFMSGGSGRIEADGDRLRLEGGGVVVTTDTVLVYEIPPHRRRDFEDCQRLLRVHGARSLGTDGQAWQAATEEDRTVECFVSDGIAHMPTIAFSRPTAEEAAEAWARPAIGMGGHDVFHVTSRTQLVAAARHYATMGADWLISRDAANFTPDGRRHQYRVAVLDLAAESGGVVFKVNVHPMFGTDRGLETVAVPYVAAHLPPRPDPLPRPPALGRPRAVRLGTPGVRGCRPGTPLGGPYRWRRPATASGPPGCKDDS